MRMHIVRTLWTLTIALVLTVTKVTVKFASTETNAPMGPTCVKTLPMPYAQLRVLFHVNS